MNAIPGDTSFDASTPATGNYQCARLESNLPSSINVDSSTCTIALDMRTAEKNASNWYTLKLGGDEIKSSNWFYIMPT